MPTIIIAEDYTATQKVLFYKLTRAGYDVVITKNGAEAFQQLQTETFDLAILDISMPIMSGFQLLEKIRQNPKTAQLPVIMLTASGQDFDREEAGRLGANAFLNKPIGTNELLDTVEKLLDD